MHQRRLWNLPNVRAARQAAAEAFLGRPMELEPLPARQAPPLPPRPTRKRKAA